MTGPWTNLAEDLKVTIMDETCMETASKKDKYKELQCRFAEEHVRATERSVSFPGKSVYPGHVYTAQVAACFDDECLPSASSQPVLYDGISRSVVFDKAVLQTFSTQEVEAEFKATIDPAVSLSNSTPCVYRWALTRDSAGSLPVSDWKVEEAASCANLQRDSRLSLHGRTQGTMHICVHPVFPWKAENPTCHRLSRPTSSNQVDPVHVIELSQETLRRTDFEEYLHSQQLGSKLHDLYDLDLDFAGSNVMLSAVLTDSTERNVTWFLMTEQRVPADSNCASDVACVTSQTTDTGKVTFPRARSKLRDGQIYFVCATVSPRTNSGLSHQPSSSQRDLCGNGIVVDDFPPVRGSVSIGNAGDGYLADNSHVQVTWQGFSDVETKVAHLPDEIALNFSVALGSYPGSEDIAHYVSVGQRTTWVFEQLKIASGVTCIATVKAEDRVGHVTEVSSVPVTVDNTPPSVGRVTVGTTGTTGNNFVAGGELTVRWEKAQDSESGVDNMEVAIFSEGGQDEIVPFQKCQGGSAILSDTTSLVDGQTYIALLKVTNRAGLTALASSEPFVVDSSPPDQGFVLNKAANSSDHGAYSTEVGVYRVYWSGFSDPHSGLHYYRVGLGSKPEQTDVHPFIYVGLQTSFVWTREFEQGKKYYATVEACNRAGLCRVTSSRSLTFDNSPPLAGHLTVGFDGHRNRYLGHNTSLPVQWTGFSDPQTGIQDFSWCVGTSSGGCDVISLTQTLLSRATVKSGVALPNSTPLYATVHARNPAGLSTVSASDIFVVDTTPPEVVTEPHFLSPRDGSPTDRQWDRSVLRLTWKFSDPDSSVVSNTVNIRSQLSGRLLVDPFSTASSTELILPLDEDHLLMDGDSYWAAVTACNAAGLCTTRTSHMLLIDSTPPVVGTFRSPLTWQKTSPSTGNPHVLVNVTWVGFADAESSIASYYVSAGRAFNGDELSRGQVQVVHNNSTRIQHWSFDIDEDVTSGEILHFSIWAENGLGLRSPIARMEFEVAPDENNNSLGSLISRRHSCEAIYCTGECTCAKSCQADINSCQDLDPARSGVEINPYIGLSSDPFAIVTSAKCLEGRWDLSDASILANISRFEVSFSLEGMSGDQGLIFNAPSESPWNDVGRNLEAVLCLPGNTTLIAQKYVLHVRAWLSHDHSVTVTSDPIVLDHTAPKVRRGGVVLDSDATCRQDVDYITTEPHVTFCWNSTFIETDSTISRFEIWTGTSPGADDLQKPVHVGLNTSFSISTTSLEQGTPYYATVRAVNSAGLMTTATSDGFTVDVTPPVAGVVFNTHGHTNRHAQSSTTSMHASWHGFNDRHSGVTSYHVALYDAGDRVTPILPFKNIGFRTKYIFEGLTLRDKHSYQVLVKAQDAAGLESKPAASKPIVIDTTPPEGIVCDRYQQKEEQTLIYTKTPSVGINTYQANFQVDESAKNDLMKVVVTAYGLEVGANGHISVGELKMPLYFEHDESGKATSEHEFIYPASLNETMTVAVDASFLARISAELYRCNNTAPSTQDSVTISQLSQYDVSVCARIHDEESGIRSMMAGLGTTPGGLQVKHLTPVGHSGHALVNVHVQHGLPLYATVHVENHAGQWSRFISQPVTMDRTPPEIRHIKLTLRYEGEGQTNSTEVWAEAGWTAEDRESGIASCECRIVGQSPVRSTTQRTNHVTPGKCTWQLRNPQHGSSVRVKISCVNGVQIHQTVTSDPAQILLLPPDLTQASLASISNNPMMSAFEKSDLEFRSSNSSLEFFWHGVDDPTVTQFQYRFLHESSPMDGWSPLDSYKTSAIIERGSQNLPTGSVTAQVRATNARQMMSDVLTTSVKVDDEQPVLTGKRATVACSNNLFSLDWQGVFKVDRHVTFSVYAGNAEGYGDVINHVITTDTSFQGSCNSQASRSLFLTISAVYATGQSTVYEEELGM
ncbi:hypothetical protein BaRGS_00015062 [Batillaria attramentaria]|uniref:Fibronectin type-III domain-containing protein n=1 Tax=Batillaria attramentaria TaxID=370345 RepID=A0ABD0L2J1_9CAEN